MTFWDKLRSILKSEASDIGDELGKARDSFDAALTRKEEELAATPKERMDMILDDIGESDDEFDRILDKAEGRTSMASATSEVRETATGKVADAVEPAEPAPEREPARAAEPATAGESEVEPVAATTEDEIRSAITDEDSPETSGATAGEDAAARAEAEKAAAAEAAAIERRRVLDARRAAADAKFEQQKAKADDILDELRGELGIEE